MVSFHSAGPHRRGGWGMAEAHGDMDCPECMDLLADYVDGSLPRHQAELLEWHLEGCGPCVAFVRTYKGTVAAARAQGKAPRLLEALSPAVRTADSPA